MDSQKFKEMIYKTGKNIQEDLQSIRSRIKPQPTVPTDTTEGGLPVSYEVAQTTIRPEPVPVLVEECGGCSGLPGPTPEEIAEAVKEARAEIGVAELPVVVENDIINSNVDPVASATPVEIKKTNKENSFFK